MTETLAHGYSSESSNEYQHDRVKMFFKSNCILVLWMKVASALEGMIDECISTDYSSKALPLTARHFSPLMVCPESRVVLCVPTDSSLFLATEAVS